MSNTAFTVVNPSSTLKGIATPSTVPNPGTGQEYWITAQAGTYTNFGGLVVNSSSVAYLAWNGSSWALSQTTITLTDYLLKSSIQLFTGTNIFDKNTMYRIGMLWGTTNGSNQTGATWASTTKMVVLPSTAYVMSGYGNRSDVSLYDASGVWISQASKSNVIGGITFTTPSNCYFVGINLTNTSQFSIDDTFQLQLGSVVTPYEPYNQTITGIDGHDIRNSTEDFYTTNQIDSLYTPGLKNRQVTVKIDGINVYVRSSISATKDIVISMKLTGNNNIALIGHTVWMDKDSDIESNITIIHSVSDNTPPLQYKYISDDGGGHGATSNLITVTSHDKDASDLLSIWTDGTHQFYLVEIRSATQLLFFGVTYVVSGENTIAEVSGNNLTYVSGGVHTSPINGTANISEQKYPVTANNSVTMKLDGVPISEDGYYTGDLFEIYDTHDVIDYSTLTIQYPMVWNDGDVMAHMNIVYRFFSNCCLQMDYNVLPAVNRLNKNFGFIQVQKTTIFEDLSRSFWYMPNLHPVTDTAGEVYDFTNIAELTNSPAGSIFINKSNLIDPAKPTERMTQILANDAGVYQIGHAHGYDISYGSLTNAQRLTNTNIGSGDVWYISDPDKSYPRGYAGKQTPTNAVINGSIYYLYFDPMINPTSTDVYYYTQGKKKVLYMDFHANLSNQMIYLPDELFGMSIINIDKSASLTLANNDVICGPGMYVTVTGGYGYAVLTLQ